MKRVGRSGGCEPARPGSRPGAARQSLRGGWQGYLEAAAPPPRVSAVYVSVGWLTRDLSSFLRRIAFRLLRRHVIVQSNIVSQPLGRNQRRSPLTDYPYNSTQSGHALPASGEKPARIHVGHSRATLPPRVPAKKTGPSSEGPVKPQVTRRTRRRQARVRQPRPAARSRSCSAAGGSEPAAVAAGWPRRRPESPARPGSGRRGRW